MPFETDIRPLFRESDRQSMQSWFDLWSYDDVRDHAWDILERVEAGEMPCDEPWDEQKVQVLRTWVEHGCPPDPTRLDGVPRVTPEGGSEVPTMTAGLDLRTPLRQVAQTGIAFIPCALNDAFRQALLQEVGGGPFIALPEQMGPKAVHQQAEAFDVSGDLTAYHLLCALRDHLVELTRDHGSGIAGLDRWLPNHAAVQRYQPGTQGISPHLDGRRFRYLVAIFTVTGSAHFALCADRAGRVLSQWQAGAGSLILMRGPGLAGIADGRPLHTVGGPSERTRVSVTYRMETRSR